jgi:hypothetical protein
MALDRQEVRKTITHQKDAEYVSVENDVTTEDSVVL